MALPTGDTQPVWSPPCDTAGSLPCLGSVLRQFGQESGCVGREGLWEAVRRGEALGRAPEAGSVPMRASGDRESCPGHPSAKAARIVPSGCCFTCCQEESVPRTECWALEQAAQGAVQPPSLGVLRTCLGAVVLGKGWIW